MRRALKQMIREVKADVRRDERYWAREHGAPKTEEAEESGRLAGVLEGLEAALKLLES